MKINIFSLIISLNFILTSCHTKPDKVAFNILQEPYQSVIANKNIYPLRYHSYSDPIHTRIVLKEGQIKDNWQPFSDIIFNYMDVYFNKENVIGFKGYVASNSKSNLNDLYKIITDKVAKDKDFTLVELKRDDPNILTSEWDSNKLILGLKYEKTNKSIAIIVIVKEELSSFYDKVFYSEFLNLTKLRYNKSQIHLKELKVKSTDSDKNFYREKFKELKNEYNKK